MPGGGAVGNYLIYQVNLCELKEVFYWISFYQKLV